MNLTKKESECVLKPHHSCSPSLSLIQGGESRVRYQVAPKSDPSHQFDVDETGAVRMVGSLDREAADTHNVLVWAVDDGSPPRTATATLMVSR